MNFFQSNIEYLKFDDRKFTIIGILSLSAIIPFIFYGMSLPIYLQVVHQEFFETLIYTLAYWLFCRWLLIFLRKKFPNYEADRKRLLWQIVVIIIAVPVIAIFVYTFTLFLYELFDLKDLKQAAATP